MQIIKYGGKNILKKIQVRVRYFSEKRAERAGMLVQRKPLLLKKNKERKTTFSGERQNMLGSTGI